MNNEYGLGMLVKSKAGRDSNKIYMISKFLKNNYYEIVNGKEKTFENPKIKNGKHLIGLGMEIETLKNKLDKQLNIYDAEVYSAIKKVIEQKGEI